MAKRNSTRRSAAGRPRTPAKGAPPASAKPSLRERIQRQLGDTPIDDSLAAVTWMQRALAVVASDLVDCDDVDDHKKRSESTPKSAEHLAGQVDRVHRPTRHITRRLVRTRGTVKSASPVLRHPGSSGALSRRHGERPRAARFESRWRLALLGLIQTRYRGVYARAPRRD